MGDSRVKIKIGVNELEVEGSEEFVKEEINHLYEKIEYDRESVNSKSKKVTVEKKSSEQNEKETKEKPYIKEFVDEKKPNTKMEEAAVLAYYLSEYDNIDEFDADDLEQLWIASGLKPPSGDIMQTVRDAKNRKSWFERVSSGTYKLSSHGIYLVRNELNKNE